MAPIGEDVLVETWRGYQRGFIRRSGRVVDPERELTTSEGQAYALVRAVWVDDPETFERVLTWTRRHLQANNPSALPAWHWSSDLGPIGAIRDANSATDADLWIAYALLLAADAWNRPAYRARALAMLPRIWEDEVAPLGDRLVLLPGPWALHEAPVRFNPSYFLPFALRRFAREDPDRDWSKVLHDGYELLEDTLSPVGLPPDWAFLDPTTGEVVPVPEGREVLTDFGFEAFRVPWNLAADHLWHQEPRARELLERFRWLEERFEAMGSLPAVWTWNGQPRETYTYLGLYGCLLPAWDVTNPALAQRLLSEVVEPSQDGRYWGRSDDYYAQNLLWLGMALHLSPPRPPGLP